MSFTDILVDTCSFLEVVEFIDRIWIPSSWCAVSIPSPRMTRRCVNDRIVCRGMATPAVLRATYRSRATHLYVPPSRLISSDQTAIAASMRNVAVVLYNHHRDELQSAEASGDK